MKELDLKALGVNGSWQIYDNVIAENLKNLYKTPNNFKLYLLTLVFMIMDRLENGSSFIKLIIVIIS